MDLTAGIHVIRAEVASTNDSRAQGLMYRRQLGPNEGMLFVFPRAEAHCMWMKNTLIPLDMVFIAAGEGGGTGGRLEAEAEAAAVEDVHVGAVVTEGGDVEGGEDGVGKNHRNIESV